MGPTIICDKSTLQALGRNELSALRTYYSLNVPPILLTEILGDLKKHNDSEAGREEVRILANKIVPACSAVNADFRSMIKGELAGHRIEMHGVPALVGGRQISDNEGKEGFIFKEPPEHKALLRWQVSDFSGAEFLLAESWRASTQAIDLEGMQRQLGKAYSGKLNLRTLQEAADFVDDLLLSAPPDQLLIWFLNDAGVMLAAQEAKRIELIRNGSLGPLHSALPFTTYCARTALIFHFGLAFKLITTKATNRLDLEYFYYAPFCHVFSSGDAFHFAMAGLVLREPTFVPRDELKADLKVLAEHLSSLPDAQNQKNVPLENEASVTYRAWKKVMKPGFMEMAKDVSPKLTPEMSAKMLKQYQDLIKSDPESKAPTMSMDDCNFIIMEHSVRADGPCICGSPKMFKDCCGEKVVAARRSGGNSTAAPS